MKIPPCDKCGEEQTELGALLFSPPMAFPNVTWRNVEKYHICVECYERMKP